MIRKVGYAGEKGLQTKLKNKLQKTCDDLYSFFNPIVKITGFQKMLPDLIEAATTSQLRNIEVL